MASFNIERSENGYTVFRDGQAIATFRYAGEAIEAMRQFKARPQQVGMQTAGVPPMIREMKARMHAK